MGTRGLLVSAVTTLLALSSAVLADDGKEHLWG
jgi:hypothetical protein